MTFYFTGTGNSLYAARKLDSEYVSIPQILHSQKLEFQADRIGVVCPVYGHEMPRMVKEFLEKAIFHTDYLYVVLTYGNRHANAVELAQKTLETAGKEADYITTLLMVDNFLPGFDLAEQMKLDKGVEQQLAEIKADIDAKKREYEEAKASVLESMRKLKTDYLDLCLLHQPFADYYGAWRALEELYETGKLRAIGVSNFYPDRLVDLASFARIKPMVNQVETHPHNQQLAAHEIMKKYGIQHEAWAPFGEGRGGLFEEETLKAIGAKYGKSTAQVILRWHIQSGVVVIPKSTHYDRMVQNLDVFDFMLPEEEMNRIQTLDKAQSSFFSHTDPAMVEWFAKMVEERKQQHDSAKEKKSW